MHIETAQHINGDSYGQKKLFIYITTDLHEQHFFASFWSGTLTYYCIVQYLYFGGNCWFLGNTGT